MLAISIPSNRRPSVIWHRHNAMMLFDGEPAPRPAETMEIRIGRPGEPPVTLGHATCVRVDAVSIDTLRNTITIGGTVHDRRALDVIAENQGFAGWADFRADLSERYPASPVLGGRLVSWKHFQRCPA